MKPSTRAVHSGERRLPGRMYSVSTPIYNSSTFFYDSVEQIDRIAGGEEEGFMYGRYANPTNVALELAVADLEGAETAWSFGSGMAALHAAILASAPAPGDTILCSQDVYGATTALLLNVFQPLGIHIRLVDFNQPAALQQALTEGGVRLAIVETISNPLLRVPDLKSVASAVHAAGAKLLVDATFSTPLLSRPLQQGANYVVHSATKYLSGHGDVMGGIVAAGRSEAAALDAARKLVGGMLGPMDAWLILRGLKTLPLRFERQCANAARIARFLATHERVETVHYPGLPEHPDHAEAGRQFPESMFGAMVAFEVQVGNQGDPASTDQTKQAVFGFIDRLQLCLPGTSLGDVQSLMLYPLIASHRALSPKQRQRAGIRDNLVRLSVGIEDADDLIQDLDQALRASEDVERGA